MQIEPDEALEGVSTTQYVPKRPDPDDVFIIDPDEVWIIARADAADAPAADDEQPGGGAMLALMPPADDGAEPQLVPMPLKHTDVAADVTAFIATVDVTQQFHNPFDSKIEAVYTFPLPQDAAVNEFVMTVGDRKIRGIIREKEEAQRIYLEARNAGHRAALLTQQRPNIFTQKVANIEPGKRIDVNIRYFHTLAYHDGQYVFTFPMVVGPRFNPPHSEDPIAAVALGSHDPDADDTQIEYLRPDERSGHDIALTLTLNPGVAVEAITSSSHRYEIAEHNDDHTRGVITLAKNDRIPNKDFVLKFKVAGQRIKSGMLTHIDDEGQGYFAMMVYPPAELASLRRRPMEMVFVLDCSGSMSGAPIAQAKAAIAHTLQQLRPADTFQIIRFSNNASQLGDRPLTASPENIRAGLKYLRQLDGSGGTMMIEGIKAALDFPHDEGRLRFVCFMTDGYIGNETEILREMHQRLGAARVFSFGVGSSPNRYLLERMAGLGRGAAAYVNLDEDATPIMDGFWRRVSRAAMTDVSIDWGGLDVTDTFPGKLNDLYVGRPLLVTGRFTGEPPASVRVRGEAAGEPITVEVAVDRSADRPALASVWARKQIASLNDRYAVTWDDALPDRIKRLALDHGLMSAYTAFLAVDASQTTAGAYGTTVHQAVPVPKGVRYDTTVTE